MDTIRQDMKGMETKLTREEAQQLSVNREEWRQRVPNGVTTGKCNSNLPKTKLATSKISHVKTIHIYCIYLKRQASLFIKHTLFNTSFCS